MTDIAFDYIYGPKKANRHDGDSVNGENHDGSSRDSNTGVTKEVMGCLLLHHMQQMPCNIHAVTAVVSTSQQSGVATKEQRRIAAGIYPTASLMNHACDPDVIVRYVLSSAAQK